MSLDKDYCCEDRGDVKEWTQIKVTVPLAQLDDLIAVMSMVNNNLMIEDYSDIDLKTCYGDLIDESILNADKTIASVSVFVSGDRSYSDDLSFIRLRAQFVLKINVTEHRVAYIYTDRAEAESYGVDTFTISRGMVNTMGDIRGIDIWVNFTETETGVIAELRSNKHNINPVAAKYGGGGHIKARGAMVKDRQEAMEMLRDLDQMQL